MDDAVDLALARALFAERRHDVAALQALLVEARASRAAGGPGLPELLVSRGVLDAEGVRARLVGLGLAPAAASPAAPPPGGPERVGPYRLVERLGAGGMGAVFRAVHDPTGAEVAVKLIHAPGAQARARLCREATAQARVDAHPNVVRVHAAGEERGVAWLAMELATGGDLAQRLERGPLPPDEAVRVVVALAEGLAHAHARGVLHRDLKPQNVLFGGDGRPRLTDFGLARVEGEGSLTATGAILGTPAYMAPEQASGGGHHADVRADVYGLGAILYHCLTGRPPFDGPGGLAILTQVLREPPVPPRRLAPAVSPGVEAVCLRALAKRPEDRPPDVLTLARELAAPPPLRPRWPRVVAAAAAVALAVALGALGLRARAEGRRAAALTEAGRVALALEAEAVDAAGAARPLLDDAPLPAAWRARRDEALAGLAAAGGGAPPPALADVDALALALEGLVALARGDLPAAARAVEALPEVAAPTEPTAATPAEDEVAGDEDAEGEEAAPGGESPPPETATASAPLTAPLAASTLALRGGLDALAPDGDPARGLHALAAARAAGVRRPELAGWEARAAARAALERLGRGEDVEAAALLPAQRVAGLSPDLARQVLEQAQGNARARLGALEQAAPGARRGTPNMAALDALLGLILRLRPGAPPLDGAGAQALERLALERDAPPAALAPHLADGAPEDGDLQRRVAAHARRLAWTALRPAVKPALVAGYLRATERALALTPPGPERDDLEALRCEHLMRQRRLEEAVAVADALLARPHVAPGCRAQAHLWRALARGAARAEILDDLDAALELDPALGRARYERARARRAAGDDQGALDDALDFLVSVDGRLELVRAHYPLATACAWAAAWRSSQVARVRPGLEAHVTAFPQAAHAGWRVRLAYAQATAGDVDAARATLEAALPLLEKQPALAEFAADVARASRERGGKEAIRRLLRPTVVALDKRRGRTGTLP
ncbi:MAG: protein kinase [Planctomycetes bacterium]|nr:protein kinase [Planctomycetota bacterium]